MDQFLDISLVIPVFVILLVIIFHTIRTSLCYNLPISITLATCVSILAVVGMVRQFGDSIGVILLPYTAMALTILLISILLFLVRFLRQAKERFRKNTSTDENKKESNERMLR
ncbi:hypothetical protein STSP2_01945 [Anaerohalosphaera lusitana]|uniref:Uncharacterized protein n=1 Tax=Anaerohalosphaera lusitana TaxID=1936003 RepID=A0A1U9NLG4_9BACT|nr:hypothetical protein STSP2_01945 [Anaerohalosphaera lusitana]